MRYLLGLFLACVCTLSASAHTKEILDTQKWPAHLARSWQHQPTRHNVFFLEQPHDQEDNGMQDPPVQPKPTPPEQSIFAGTAVGLIFLLGGLIGWFILAASVFVLERRAR